MVPDAYRHTSTNSLDSSNLIEVLAYGNDLGGGALAWKTACMIARALAGSVPGGKNPGGGGGGIPTTPGNGPG